MKRLRIPPWYALKVPDGRKPDQSTLWSGIDVRMSRTLRADPAQEPRRSSSSSTTDGSSLRKTGFGAASGVPATSGTDAQRAPTV